MTYSGKREFVAKHKDEFIDWLNDEKIHVYLSDEMYKMYDEYLDTMVDLPDFGVLTYGYALILHELDPVAYQCGYSDFLDAYDYMECDDDLFDGDYFESRHHSSDEDVFNDFIEYMEKLNAENEDDDEDEDEAEIEV